MAEGELKDCNVFPPSNHEGLHIQSDAQHDPPSSSSLPSPDDVRATVLGFGLPRLFAFGFDLLHSKLFAIASPFRRYSKTRLTLSPFGGAGVLTVLVLAFVYIKLRRRRRRRPHSWEASVDHLMHFIRERDEVDSIMLYLFILGVQCP